MEDPQAEADNLEIEDIPFYLKDNLEEVRQHKAFADEYEFGNVEVLP